VRYADAGFPRDWDLSGSMGPSTASIPAAVPTPFPTGASSSYASPQTALPSGQMDILRAEHANMVSGSQSSSILSSLVDTLSAAVTSSSSSASASATTLYEFGRVECSVKLSYPKALLPKSTPYEARLFFLCTKPIPQDVLEDAFSSFGDLINVYFISGKNCGYIMYASRRAAEAALMGLNNATLAGSKLKILQADPEPTYKRQKTEEST